MYVTIKASGKLNKKPSMLFNLRSRLASKIKVTFKQPLFVASSRSFSSKIYINELFVGDGSYLISWRSNYASKYWTKILVNSLQVKDPLKYVEVVSSQTSPQHSWLEGNKNTLSKRLILNDR